MFKRLGEEVGGFQGGEERGGGEDLKRGSRQGVAERVGLGHRKIGGVFRPGDQNRHMDIRQARFDIERGAVAVEAGDGVARAVLPRAGGEDIDMLGCDVFLVGEHAGEPGGDEAGVRIDVAVAHAVEAR